MRVDIRCVFPWCPPAEILQPIVAGVSVHVATLRTGWTGSDECFEDKSMDLPGMHFLVSPEINAEIGMPVGCSEVSSWRHIPPQTPASPVHSRPLSSSLNSTRGRDAIVRKAWDFSPLFFHRVVLPYSLIESGRDTHYIGNGGLTNTLMRHVFMGRPSKPWYWAARDAWYVTIRGERIALAKGKDAKAAATLAFHQLMASEGKIAPGGDVLTVHVLANLFLHDQEARKLAPLTVEFYRRHLGSFVSRWGGEIAASIRPLNISAWLRENDWSDSTKAGAVASVKRLYNWARKEGHLADNPIVGIERPAMSVRAGEMTRQQADSILRASKNPAFKDFIIALWETGCRPGEMAEVTASQFNSRLGTLKVKNKTRRKTREPFRTIHLTPFMGEICKELAKRNPEGPIFLNQKGRPWTRNAMACAFRVIRKRIALPEGISAYSMRHGYVTDALERGVPIATVAALVGHTDATMILKVYSKLSSRQSHLKDAASQVRPASQNNPSIRESTE